MLDQMQELVYTRYVIFLVGLLIYPVHRYLEKRAERKVSEKQLRALLVTSKLTYARNEMRLASAWDANRCLY